MTTPHNTKAPASLGWVLAITAVGSLVVGLDQLVVATALQSMQRDLHSSLTSLEWTVNAFSLSIAALMIPGAGLGDWIGRKRTFLIGLVVFALASVACALAPNIDLLLPARVLQGAGGAMILPAALALLTASTPALRRGAVMGAYAAVMGLAVVGGPLVGGVVTQGIAWQWIFWINVPVIAVVLPFAYAKLGEAKGAPVPFDIVGVFLAAAAMFGIVWALVRSGSAGWGSGEVLGTLIGGVALLACFVGWELRTPQPMIAMRLFTIREFAAGNLAALMLTASLMSTVFFLAQYLQIALGYSPLGAGLRFLPFTIPVLFVPPIAGRLQDRIGPRWLISVGMTLQGTGMLGVAYSAHQHHGYGSMIAALVVAGFGTTMALPAQQSAVMTSVPLPSMGKAAGTFSTLRQLGGAVGIAILAAVFAAHGNDSSSLGFTDGFSAAMIAAAILAFAGAAAGLLAPGRQAVPHVAPAAPTIARGVPVAR